MQKVGGGRFERRHLVSSLVLCLGLALGSCGPRPGEPDDEPTPVAALDYIANVFDRYPVVALSEVHGNRESAAFLSRLIRHDGFSRRVNDIVIEFGNAAYQPVVDRYIAGAQVERDELRGTWENTTQISGIWSLPQYESLLADIRAVNATLPVERRYRVLLGDPPIDWRMVTRPSDEDMNDWRDAHVAFVVERHVMATHRRALIYFGGAHFGRKVLFPNSAIHLLDARLPGKTFVVGTLDVGQVQPKVAAAVRGWPTPSVIEVRDTWLGRSDVAAIGFAFSRGRVQDDVDALLLMSAAPLVMQPPPVIDAVMLDEFERRRRLAAATAPFRGGLIRFEPDGTGLTPESSAPLQRVVTELLRDDGIKVLVKAFADAGEREPLVLSNARAKAVADRLTAAGVSSTRVAARGCGAARPLWADETPDHRAANRRVEIVTQTPTAGCQPPRWFDVAPTSP
jgi:outer membrane protein OmpA-like peptidoglycan-associated protein